MWPVASVIVSFVHCVKIAAGEPSDINREAVERIVAEMDRMPPWPMLPFKSTTNDRERVQRDAVALEESALNISKYSSADIRQAMVQYNGLIRNQKRDWRKDKALFIINKFLFDIPEFVTWGAPEVASLRMGWWGPWFLGDPNDPQPTDKVLARWPWFSDEQGRWHFTTDSKWLERNGPPYDPVRQFDALLAMFGRRSPRREQ